MENQAKKRKSGAEKFRQKDITFTRQGFTNEKTSMFILHKAPKTILRSNKGPKFLRARIKCGSTHLSLQPSITSNTDCACISTTAVVAYIIYY